MAEQKDFKYIVRVANNDLKGEKIIVIALQKIKGIGDSMAIAICRRAKVNAAKRAGELKEDEVKRLQDVIENIDKQDFPTWFYNRQKDFETGEDVHILGADLTFTHDNDLKRMKKAKTYKGFRHQWGLPVRGQRTSSNFRPSKSKASKAKKRK